eukprot:scaffold1120_cov127-Cylindrotheca_fusiformis.AAC.7
MASSSYFTPNRGQRSRRPLQSSSAAMGSRTPRNLVAARTAASPRSGYWSSQQSSSSGIASQRHRRNPHLPRTVTPTGSNNLAGHSPSWDEFDEHAAFPRRSRPKFTSSDRSVASTSYMEDEEDMPMDELEDTRSVQSMPPIQRTHLRHRRSNSASTSDHHWNDISTPRSDARPTQDRRILSMEFGSNDLGQIGLHRKSHSNISMDWADDVSSLGGVDDRPSGLGDIMRALKHRSKSRPSHLNSEERALWDSIQTALTAVKNEEIANKRAQGKLLQDAIKRESQMERRLIATQKQLMAAEDAANSGATSEQLKMQVRVLETTLKAKQAEHETELRAIQRVLAEMTEEREQETGELIRKVDVLNATVKELEAQTEATIAGSEKSETVINLEDNLAKMKGEKDQLLQQISILKQEVEDLKEEVATLNESSRVLEPEAAVDKGAGAVPCRSMTPPRHNANHSDAESVSSEEVESLQRSLLEKATSLENAKKIIASLENANGSLTMDLRSKLKAKEQELLVAQNESADSKRRLDILATELRDLQRKYGDSDRAEKETKAQTSKCRALIGQLEKSVANLQSAAVVHEVSAATGQPDASNVDLIGDILSDTLTILRTALDSTPRLDSPSSLSATGVADLQREKATVMRLEEALKTQNEEVKKLRSQLEQRNQGHDHSLQQLKVEIQTLRDQCASNMDVLAQKERELSVLRSSLKVDENDAGYISDDESGDEQDSAAPSAMNFGAADSRPSSPADGSKSTDFDMLRNQLLSALSEKAKTAQDLQAERESLANAKMIISSLENANKRMMEDLRLRLQDSNSTVASLMDKSSENEKKTNELREQIELLKKEKEEEREKHLSEIIRLKQQNNIELQEKDSKSGVEEKKEEVDDASC